MKNNKKVNSNKNANSKKDQKNSLTYIGGTSNGSHRTSGDHRTSGSSQSKQSNQSNQSSGSNLGNKSNWVLITGASSGIGEACAWEMAALGYDLILTARREGRLKEIQSHILKKHPARKVKVFKLDVANKKNIQQMCTQFKNEFSRLAVLVNNAGLAIGVDKLHEAKAEDFDTVMNTNVMGLLYVTRAILPNMVANQYGHIINLGSVAGRWVYPGGAVYCASKFSVRAISEGLRMDLLGQNIRVTNIEPGMVNTEFSKVRFKDQAKADQVYKGMNPLLAQDIAETIAWVASRPSHVNIQELVIYPTDQAHINMVHRRS